MLTVPILINEDDIFSQFPTIKKEEIEELVDFVIKEITASFARKWELQANQQLHQTRILYTSNLKVVDEGRMEGSVILDYTKHPLVEMLEEGASPFDMKEGFEKSDKAVRKKDGGWYLTIPFRWGTPGIVAESTMFTGVMPTEVYNVVKSKPIDSPILLGELTGENAVPKVREEVVAENGAIFQQYKNKSALYEGIVKKTDPVTLRNRYVSFRRVSNNSDENAWIHTGLEAHQLAEKAMQVLEANIEAELQRALDNGLKILGYDV